MAEYIEREAALAFQNEVEPLLCRNVVTHDIMSATKDADMVKYLQSIPAADVRPVVLCRDCKRYGGRPWENNESGICARTDVGVGEFDFCSYGEKREEDQWKLN